MSLPFLAPRLQLADLPTPLEPMPRLTKVLGGPKLWVKRDDLTGLAFGGNKTRKLEFLFADALLARATSVLTFGAVQSNHARQTAAAAARLGMPCDLVLSEMVARDDPAYRNSGNVMLDRMLGASIHHLAKGADPEGLVREIVARREREGHRLYLIPPGGSNVVGATSYALAFHEILLQARACGVEPSAIVHASSSAGTQAGLLAGQALAGEGPSIIGVNVFKTDGSVRDAVTALADETSRHLGATPPKRSNIEVVEDQIGPGYGQPTEPMKEALQLAAETDGLILDPVYSGKAMAGLIAMIRAKRWTSEESVIFLHTGGTPALFSYSDLFASPRHS
jgi:D-cysteine desulfhydrase family pyridoxal phosphate-dependent enzyme